jgi:hypothetical protein
MIHNLPTFENLPKVNQEQLRQRATLTNMQIACYLLGWQGGTIHQVAEETGLSVDEILKSKDIEADINKKLQQGIENGR